MVEEVSGDEIFQRMLAGKIWMDNSFNVWAFMNTMVGAWKIKNQVETQELSKNIFWFMFVIKRDLECVIWNSPWRFDKNLLIIARVSREEQPYDLNMHFGVFWVRINEFPLMLRLEVMTRKIGGILGSFEEINQKEFRQNGRFLRIKLTMDLKQ